MNSENLHELINKYEENYAYFNDKDHDEIFKWKAVSKFRKVWFSDDKPNDFSQFFKEARKDFSVLVDNAQVAPTSGIIKLAEKYPQEVENLFRNVLFAEDNGDIDLKQKHIDSFIDGIEALRQKEFPRYYKYKQDRHAASCYMACFDPEHNYIYRYSEAEVFACYIEFGLDIGSGENFKLKNYYKLCDVIVDALKEHPTLIDKYHQLVYSDDYYPDESLHLLAFDLMYCCRNYNLYYGMTHIPKKDSVKSYKLEQLRQQQEDERQQELQKLNSQKLELELSIEPYKDISLVDVEVLHKIYGKGIITSQKINQITVKFENVEKRFMIHKQYVPNLPTFENDEEVLEAFTTYADVMKQIEQIERQIKKLQ